MKKVLMCGAVALLLIGVTYAADNFPVTAEIPFSFYVGNTQMPAGEYQVAAPLEKMWVVRAKGEDRRSAYTLVYGISTNSGSKDAQLVFTKYADGNYFLSEIWHPLSAMGFHIAKGKREHESITSRFIASNRPETVIVIAKAR